MFTIFYCLLMTNTVLVICIVLRHFSCLLLCWSCFVSLCAHFASYMIRLCLIYTVILFLIGFWACASLIDGFYFEGDTSRLPVRQRRVHASFSGGRTASCGRCRTPDFTASGEGQWDPQRRQIEARFGAPQPPAGSWRAEPRESEPPGAASRWSDAFHPSSTVTCLPLGINWLTNGSQTCAPLGPEQHHHRAGPLFPGGAEPGCGDGGGRMRAEDQEQVSGSERDAGPGVRGAGPDAAELRGCWRWDLDAFFTFQTKRVLNIIKINGINDQFN